MALTAEKIRELGPELLDWLAVKASESMDEPEGMEAHEAAPSPESGGGPAVVIAMKPKPSGEGGKVHGCPDCADGTPHQHVK